MLENNIPWIEKYRPNKLENIKSQDFVKQSLQKLVETNTIPHLLFFGSPGTGKTSTIIACTKELERNGYIVSKLELNTSDILLDAYSGVGTFPSILANLVKMLRPIMNLRGRMILRQRTHW